MKLAITAAMALAFAAPAFADPAGDMKAMPGMSAAQGADQSPVIMADGAGVVKAVVPGTGVVTIQHGAIAGLKWPAMTMAFKATSPSLLHGVRVGQVVSFRLMKRAGGVQLTAIHPK